MVAAAYAATVIGLPFLYPVSPSKFLSRNILAVSNSSPIIPSRSSHVRKVYFSFVLAVRLALASISMTC